MPWSVRVFVVSCVLVSGCFSEPATVPAGETDDDASSSESGGAGSSEAGSGFTDDDRPCELTPVTPGELSADVVLAIDPALSEPASIEVNAGLGDALALWDSEVRLAVLSVGVPPGDYACDTGCPCRFGDAPALWHPLPAGVPENPLEVLSPVGPYSCVFRTGDLPTSTKHMVFVTERPDEPNVAMPAVVAQFLDDEDVRFYAVCPACTEEDGGDVLEAAGSQGVGAAGLTRDGVGDALRFAGMHRASCAIPYDGPTPDLVVFETPTTRAIPATTEEGAVAGRVDAPGDCSGLGPDGEIYLEFVAVDGYAVLCPMTCALLQYDAYEDVEMVATATCAPDGG